MYKRLLLGYNNYIDNKAERLKRRWYERQDFGIDWRHSVDSA